MCNVFPGDATLRELHITHPKTDLEQTEHGFHGEKLKPWPDVRKKSNDFLAKQERHSAGNIGLRSPTGSSRNEYTAKTILPLS